MSRDDLFYRNGPFVYKGASGTMDKSIKGKPFVDDLVAAASSFHVSVNIGGTWKTVSAISVNVGGTWKTVSAVSGNIGGTWKTV